MTRNIAKIAMALLTFVCLSATIVTALTAENDCEPGHYFNSEARVCDPCPFDTYKPNVTGPCRLCPMDEFGVRAVTRTSGAFNVSQCIFRPYIGSFSPTYGPISGGTEVQLRIHHLQDRRIIVLRFIHIDAERDYHFSAPDENGTIVLTCWTSYSNMPKSGSIHMQLADNENEYSFDSERPFHYRPDPAVFTIHDIRAIVSGGILIDVNGTFFTSVAHPFLIVTRIYHGVHKRFVTPCEVRSNHLMTCLTPNLTEGLNISAIRIGQSGIDDVQDTIDQGSRIRRDLSASTNWSAQPINSDDLRFFAGFKLDGVQEYENFTELPVYWDPIFYRFKEAQHVKTFNPREHPFIDIQGARIGHGILIGDISVTVGEEVCNITFLATNFLTCRPPEIEPRPEPGAAGPGHSPMVLVKVGVNLSFVIGYLHYVNGTDTFEPPLTGTTEQPTNTNIMTIVIAVVCVFWVLLISACCAFFMCRRQRRRRKYKYKCRTPTPEAVTYVEGGSVGSSNSGYLPPSSEGRLENGYLRPILDQETTLSVIPNGRHYHNDIMAIGGQYNGLRRINGNIPQNGNYVPHRYMTETSTPGAVLVGLDERSREKVKACCLDSRRLTVGSLLGSGNYGKVHKGVMVDENFRNGREVAVKTLKDSVQCAEMLKDFLEEALMMKGFSHPHVLSLHGVVIRGLKPYVVLEYMDKGDLKTYVSVKALTMTVGELLDLAYQVSEGMVYLAAQGFVHRDLAARNCMINSELKVKIADFGLSRDIHEKEYYTASDRERPMPVKWMAIESLNNGRYTTKSDVWAFGVLMWEVLKRGVTPYPDVDNFDVRNYLNEGHRLDRPANATDQIYNLMKSCWKTNPCDRPDFADISNGLKSLMDEHRELHTHQYLTVLADTEPCCETSWTELGGGSRLEPNNNDILPVDEEPWHSWIGNHSKLTEEVTTEIDISRET